MRGMFFTSYFATIDKGKNIISKKMTSNQFTWLDMTIGVLIGLGYSVNYIENKKYIVFCKISLIIDR